MGGRRGERFNHRRVSLGGGRGGPEGRRSRVLAGVAFKTCSFRLTHAHSGCRYLLKRELGRKTGKTGASGQAIFHSWMERSGGLCYAFPTRDLTERRGVICSRPRRTKSRVCSGLGALGTKGPSRS